MSSFLFGHKFQNEMQNTTLDLTDNEKCQYYGRQRQDRQCCLNSIAQNEASQCLISNPLSDETNILSSLNIFGSFIDKEMEKNILQ